MPGEVLRTMIDLSQHTYLFTIAERVMIRNGMILYPGVSRKKGNPRVRKGDQLILRNHRGDHVTAIIRGIGQPVGEDQTVVPISIRGDFHRSDISLGTEVYLESAAAVGVGDGPVGDGPGRSAHPAPATTPPMRAPQGWGMSFFHEKPCCPNCGSTELMLIERKYPFEIQNSSSLWRNPHGSLGLLTIGFPIGFLIMLQSPILMKCDACGTDFLCRSRHVRIYRLLLVCAVGAYALLLRKCFGL